ncbi:hypothetical protein M0805_005296 [Coniferiporia weirii]|nr:hypothetical protein M0805_005296 [Coniferiporia weirii]
MALGAYSNVGKTRLRVYALLYAVNIVVLALSTRINQFQSFFFVADLFPFGLSIATLVLLSISLLLDLTLSNSFTSRPPFEIALLGILSVFWLAFNAFSTSRWRHVPLACGAIPAEFVPEREWCRDLQALKAFVWVEWVILLLATLFTVRFTIREHARGNTHVWSTSLSRYATRYRDDTSASASATTADYAFGGMSASDARGGVHRRTRSSFLTSFEINVGSRQHANATGHTDMRQSFVDFTR